MSAQGLPVVASATVTVLSTGDQAALLSAFIAVGSFCVVYQLAALQAWQGRFPQLLERSNTIAMSAELNSVERLECLRQAGAHLRTFPRASVVTMGVIQVVLAALSLSAYADGGASGLSWKYMLLPPSVLLASYLFSTLWVWRSGVHSMLEIESALGHSTRTS